MRQFKSYPVGQVLLLPPNVEEWLSRDHPARFIRELVHEHLDLSDIRSSYDSKFGRGAPPYDPAMMIALLLYGYAFGVRSSRKLEAATHDELGVRYLTANQHPDHDSIAHFRKQHLSAFEKLFLVTLRLCAESGLIKLGELDLYLDGTKMLANASRHQTVSYARIRKTEQQLKESISSILAEAAALDDAEDAEEEERKRSGQARPDFRDKEALRRTLRAAEERLTQASAGRAMMEREAREEAERQAEAAKAKRSAHDREGKRGRKPQIPDVKQLSQELCEASRINLTDADSRLMVDGATKATVQAYNCQAVCAAGSQVIVACAVTSEENDVRQLAPMAKTASDNLAQVGAVADAPRRLGADAGYLSVDGVADARCAPYDLYIAPGAAKRIEAADTDMSAAEEPDADAMPSSTVADALEASGFVKYIEPDPAPTPAALLRERMIEKMSTPEGKAFYDQRSASVEPAFAETKEARGIRRLLLRGREAADAEWRLICLTHNIRKLFRSRQGPRPPSPKRALSSVRTDTCASASAQSLQMTLGAA